VARKNIRIINNPVREVRVVGTMSDDERRGHVWEMRLRGRSYAEIAREMVRLFPPGTLPKNYDGSAVYRDSAALLNELRGEFRETAVEMVEIEAKRYDKLLEGIWGAAEAGDLAAIDRVLTISKERRKMFGLDKPENFVVDWRIEVINLLERGVITPAEIVQEFGEEALISVNQLLLEKKDE
jgi:hypothetical protein